QTMAEARVESIDALKSLKAALLKFAEGANIALADAESEVIQTMNWLENEQVSYWQSQLRQRTELVASCLEAVRMKKLYKDSAGRTPSAIEEEKALRKAKIMLEEAQEKIGAVRRAIVRMDKEVPLYKGLVQRFGTTVVTDIPAAAAQLDNFV